MRSARRLDCRGCSNLNQQPKRTEQAARPRGLTEAVDSETRATAMVQLAGAQVSDALVSDQVALARTADGAA